MNQQIFLFLLSGMAGFLFHCLVKARSLKSDAEAIGIEFNITRDYIKKDIFGILIAFLSPFVWLLLFGEIATKYPVLKEFAITSFFVFGAMGSYIIQLWLSKTKKAIRKAGKDLTTTDNRPTTSFIDEEGNTDPDAPTSVPAKTKLP